MKAKLTILFIIAAISTLLLACSPASQQASVEVSCDDFSQNNHITKEVQVASGSLLTVTLCSNPTTGFQWSETAQISDQTVLQQIDHKLVSAEEPGVVGAPGQEVWTFKALEKGTASLSLEYSQPWEGGGKGEWTFNLTALVK
jgi:inhibitor of cysteine peptidase